MPRENNYLEVIPKNDFNSSKQDNIQSRIYLDGNLQKLKLVFFYYNYNKYYYNYFVLFS